MPFHGIFVITHPLTKFPISTLLFLLEMNECIRQLCLNYWLFFIFPHVVESLPEAWTAKDAESPFMISFIPVSSSATLNTATSSRSPMKK